MEFDLSSDQAALRDAARDLLHARASSERVRKVVDGSEGYDRELWREMVAQGWSALALPEERGGLGLGFVEVAVLAEQVGRHVAPAPYLSTALALHALASVDGPPVEAWVGHLASGGVGAVAWGDAPVVDAPVADVVVVVGADAVTAHDVTGARPKAQPAMDVTRRVGWARDLPDGVRLGGAGLAREMLDRGATAYAAELLGAAARMLEVSVEYAKVREQFGRPIGSFQAVKHRCADMLADVEGMWSAVYYAAWALAAAEPDASLAASTAKAWCADAGPRVIASALQVHGGVGFTWEHDLHLYLKRAQLDAVTFGSASWHRERIMALLRERLAAGQTVF